MTVAIQNGISKVADVTVEVGGQENVKRLQSIARDFRSDTLTIPTDAMLLAGLQASRGDDVYREDEVTAALEARVARLAGKEAGLFLVSGTMSNQLAIRSHLTQPPHSVLLDYRAHVHKMEAGGIAVFSQATSHSIVPENHHHITLEEVQHNLELGEDIHTAPTKLISLENTLSGMVFPQDEIVKIAEEAQKNEIIMHLDGARIWEVAAKKIGKEALVGGDEVLQPVLTELCAPFKTVSLCLSKGIGAPIGSVLVGPKDVIKRAMWFRKMFGGGIRQSGAIAAAAHVALTNNFPRLHQTHILAKKLADGIEALGGKLINPTETNMVWINLGSLNVPVAEFVEKSAEKGITVRGSRIVVHHQIEESAIDDLLEVITEIQAKYSKDNGNAVSHATSKPKGSGY